MKIRSTFVCQQCGYISPQWLGKCTECGAWGSLVETVEEKVLSSPFTVQSKSNAMPQKLSDVKHVEKNRVKSGYGEFDRVMGGGIVPGSVTILSGDPGIGKSTLLLHILGRTGGLYVAGEESAEQVKLRAKRLGIDGSNIDILTETNVESIIETIRQHSAASSQLSAKQAHNSQPAAHNQLIIIDSIQTLQSSELEGMAGSVGQIRHCAELLTSFAKGYGMSIVMIGHVTKDGAIAGPKVLEHMVDTVLFLEGERFASARILRTLKNRFGAVEEVGIFDMDEKGLREIDNPSEIFLKDRVKNVPGSVVTVIMEGTRPLLVEIQALTVVSQLPIPRRVANGFDLNRLQLLIAILQKRLNIPLGTSDVFVNVSGGIKIHEPAADLAVALAIVSSFQNKSLGGTTAVLGELGLLGELRSVGSEDRRIKEAKRLGFTTVVSPKSSRTLKDSTSILG